LVIDWVSRTPFIVPRREANPAFHAAVVAMCHAARIAPTFVEADSAEQALLSVAGGAGIALLPNSVTERHTGSGVRFLPVRGATAAFASAALTDPARETPATVLLLRVLTWATRATPLASASAAASTRAFAMAKSA
jgi:DNA-binding transcriptional LysR family regulator